MKYGAFAHRRAPELASSIVRSCPVRTLQRICLRATVIALALAAYGEFGDARAAEPPASTKDIPRYIETLREGNTGSASAARERLAQMGEPAVPALVAALKDEQGEVRAHAAYALRSMGPKAKAAVPALISALQDPVWEVRDDAAGALERIGTNAKDAVPGLIGALSDANDHVAAHAASALRAVGPDGKGAIPALIENLSYQGFPALEAQRTLEAFGAVSVPALGRAMSHKEVGVRRRAASALQTIGKDAGAAVPSLIAALKDSDSEVRSTAASALGAIGPAANSASGSLVPLLKDEDSRVRLAAGEALTKIGADPKTRIPVLVQAMRDQDVDVWQDAIKTVKGMGTGATPALVTVLRNDSDPEVRRRAAVALEGLGPAAKGAVPALIAALKDEKVRFNATVALGRIGPAAQDAVIPLSELLNDRDLSMNAAIALREIGPGSKIALPALIEALRNKNPETRFYAASAVAVIGPEAKSAVPALILLLKDDDPKVRSMAAEALSVFLSGAKATVPALTDALKDEDAEVRDSAAAAVGVLAQALADKTDTSSIPALTKTLRTLEDGNFQPKFIGAVREPLESLVDKERAGVQPPLNEDEALAAQRRGRNLVVQISGQLDGENVVGTGIIFGSSDDRLYIATARHVVRRNLSGMTMPRVRMQSLPGEALPAQLLEHSDRDLDLAVMEIRDVRKYKIPVERILPFDRVGKTQNLQPEAKLFALGLPAETTNLPAQPDEFVKAVGVQLVFQSGSVKKGYSGGAVFNSNWQLIAMIRADEPPFSQAVAIDQIIARLKDWGYPVALTTSQPGQRR